MLKRSINLPKNQHFFLFGPRQTGKTTLLRQEFSSKSTLYYDLLLSETYLKFSARPERFREEILSRDPAIQHVIVDEVQRIPNLLNEVHALMESGQSPYFVLTGSSARKLKRSQANLLGGRALTYSLYPLSVLEMGKNFQLSKALQFGSLPTLFLEKSPKLAVKRLQSYVETYLKEEIELEAQVRQLGRFLRFLQVAAQSNGKPLNYSNIARETACSYHTVKAYFQILEDTLLGNFLYPYLKSKRKRLSQRPKFYFFDTGITRALQKKASLEPPVGSTDFGDAFEHWVILEIFRHASYTNQEWDFSYYRTESGLEVDLIIESPQGNMLAIEIKSTNNLNNGHLKGLKSFSKDFPQAHLACLSQETHRRQKANIDLIPWQEAIAWIEEKANY